MLNNRYDPISRVSHETDDAPAGSLESVRCSSVNHMPTHFVLDSSLLAGERRVDTFATSGNR